MWFVFGLITLLLSIAAALYWRALAGWRGTRHDYRDLADGAPRSYEFETRQHKQRYVGYRLGIRGGLDFDFQIRRENAFDRIANDLGVSREQTSGDRAFDARFYFESDDVRVGRALRDNAAARHALEELFHRASAYGHRPQRLRVYGGRMWIEVKGSADPLPAVDARAIADQLYVLRQAFAAQSGNKTDHDPFVWRASILLAISSGLAATAVLTLFRLHGGRSELLDPWGMFVAVVWILVPATFAAIVLALRWLRASARSHRVLAELATLGAAGAVICGFGLLRELNTGFDPGTVRRIELDDARVTHQKRRCGRRNRSTCHDYFLYAAWPDDARPADGRLRLDAGQFYRLDGHDRVQLDLKPGLLGFVWVEDVHGLPNRRRD